jgi:hypothetical protein
MRARQRKFARNAIVALAIVAFSAAISADSGSSTSAQVHLRSAQPATYGPVAVSGRASAPTDIRSTSGIEVEGKYLELGIGARQLVISADDWNTIIGTSDVPVNIGMMVDPRYNPMDLTRNRFQYLADRISLYRVSDFDVLGIVSGLANGHFMATIAIYNPTSQVIRLSHLSVQIIAQPPRVTEASGVFYTANDGGCIIPANTIYFAYLEFPHFEPAPKTAPEVVYKFSSPPPAVCLKQVCHTGLPIVLCQE